MPPKHSHYRVLAATAFALALIAGALWAGWTLIQPMIRDRIVLEAEKRGIAIEFESFALSLDGVSLHGVSLRPIGARGLAAVAEDVRIDLDGIALDAKPLRIVLHGLDVHALGSAPALALELAEWTQRYPAAYGLPIAADRVNLAWRAGPSDKPWVQIAGGSIQRHGESGSFEAKEAGVLGVKLGPVGASWAQKTGKVSLGLGKSTPEEAPVTLDVHLEGSSPTAKLNLRPTPLGELSGPLGVELPLANVTAEATATIELPRGVEQKELLGAISVDLIGYVPPHPVELNGFVFGDRTTFQSGLVISPDRTEVKLVDTEVTAGAFALRGDGEVQRGADHARVRMRLTGNLPCVALAGAAADTHLGRAWASFAKKVAKKNLNGSVGVTVNIDADTRDLPAAKVTQSIGVGCGLQPLRAPTRAEMDEFARDIPGLIDELPDLPKELPRLPAGLPELKIQLPEGKLPGGKLPFVPDPPSATGAEDAPPKTSATP